MYTHVTTQVKVQNISSTPEGYSCPSLVNTPSPSSPEVALLSLLYHQRLALPVFECQMSTYRQTVIYNLHWAPSIPRMYVGFTHIVQAACSSFCLVLCYVNMRFLNLWGMEVGVVSSFFTITCITAMNSLA